MTVDPTPVLPPADAASDGMVRSEEHLESSTSVRVSGGQRLHKYVVTERVTQTVEVRREELRVIDLSVDELSVRDTLIADLDGYEFHDRDFEIVLHEERAVITKEIVPVARVRVRTRVVTEQVDLSATVRREQIDLDPRPAAEG